MRIPVVRAGHDGQRQFEVLHRARNRPDCGEPLLQSARADDVSRAWDPAGRRLEAGHAAAMCRVADAARRVTADIERRAARRDNGRGAATAATRSARQVVRVARQPVDQVVGLVGQRQFRRVGLAEDDGAGGLQTCDHGCVGAGDEVLAAERAGRRDEICRVEGVLDRDGYAVQRPEGVAAFGGAIGLTGLCQRRCRALLHDGVDVGVHGRDPVETGRDDGFSGRGARFDPACQVRRRKREPRWFGRRYHGASRPALA